MSAVAPEWCNVFRRIPYVDLGRSRDGVDCYGLVLLVNREQFGRSLPDYAYRSSLDPSAVNATISTHLPHDFRRVEEPVPGDLVMLQILGRPWHCGVYVAPGLMLHVIGHAVSGIDRLGSVRWHRRIRGYYRPVTE